MELPNTDIECPRCYRVSFAHEKNSSCVECHWCIRPAAVEKPYGFDLLIEVRTEGMLTAKVERHYKGNEATARRRCRAVPRFVLVLAVVPLSEEVWMRAYGEGKM